MMKIIMNSKLLLSVLTASFSLTSLAINTPARAGGTVFFCGKWQGTPATLAMTAKGTLVPIIRWQSGYFNHSGYTPQKRCDIVSRKFQSYYQNGKLKFLNTGRVNKQNVVCVTDRNEGPCDGVLFTLKPESDPNQTLLRLLSVRVQAGGPLNESERRVYIDMDKYIQETSQENNNNSHDNQPESKNSQDRPEEVW
jgi:hypothetical protein